MHASSVNESHDHASTLTSFIRPVAPALMVTAALLHLKVSAIKPTSSSFAFPSTGGDFSLATHVPSAAWESSDTLARGLTFTCRIRSAISLLGFVANHFDVVAVRTDDESRVVIRVVARAQSRRTVVLAARFHSAAIESLDLLAILGHERQVKVRRLLFGLEQAQRNLAPWWAKLDTVRRRPLPDNGYAERFECLEEERFARCKVADSELDVVEHDYS